MCPDRQIRYEGPIYRPPSEADSLLIQATVGCPHNKCTFCMVYKQGPSFKIRPVAEIVEDLETARRQYGAGVRRLFLPAGNTIAMPAADLEKVCRRARRLFPALERITVYGSCQYIHRKGPEQLKSLRQAGLTRIHVGLETGDGQILKAIRKGTNPRQQIEAGRWVRQAGIELHVYVLLGIGGRQRSRQHARNTARVLNAMAPDCIRLRTFVPKVNTALLRQVLNGSFQMLGPHQVLEETGAIVEALKVNCRLTSDHYTNYIDLEGNLPEDIPSLLEKLSEARKRPEESFRPFFIGTQ